MISIAVFFIVSSQARGATVAQCDVSMPQDWLPLCQGANLFFSKGGSNTGKVLMPEIANGYLGTVMNSDTIYVGGLFNGDATGKFGPASHRARIPAFHVSVGAVESSATATSGNIDIAIGQALDISRGIFTERSYIGSVFVEQRTYAHFARPWLLVHEIDLTNTAGSAASVALIATPSPPSSDLILTEVNSTGAAGDFTLFGRNLCAEDATVAGGGNHTEVAFISNSPCGASASAGACESTMQVPPGVKVTRSFITTVVVSLNSTAPLKDAIALHDAAQRDAALLLSEHEAAWATRWARGSIEVEGDLRLAQAVNASLYSLRSSIRDDWPFGLSPGGITTDGYNGTSQFQQFRACVRVCACGLLASVCLCVCACACACVCVCVCVWVCMRACV